MSAAAKKPEAKPAPTKSTGSSVFDMLGKIKQTTGDGTLRVARTDVVPDPDQHRKVFTDANLDNMAASLRKVGFLQPLLVEKTGGTPPYKLVDGERRWRAAERAGLTEVPVFVREQGKDRRLAQAIANANRQGLTDAETALQIQDLLDASKAEDPKGKGLKKSEIAELLDYSSAQVSQFLAMLDPEYKHLVDEGLIVKADAMTRFRSCPPEVQQELISEARSTGEPITVLQLRKAKAAIADAAPAAGDSSAPAPGGDGVAAEPVGPVSDTTPAAVDSSSASGGSAAPDSAGNITPAAGDALGGAGSIIPVETGSADAGSDEDTIAGDASSSTLYGGSDHDTSEDDDGASRDDAGDTGHGPAIRTGDATSNAPSTPRPKAASVRMTGERVEMLLRYLVDKSTDQVEVKLSADLAIAVIENLGGVAPASPDAYGATIAELIGKKFED